MKYNYSRMSQAIIKLNSGFESCSGAGKIQRVFSTPHLVCFTIRFPGITKYLYIGRGNHFECIGEGDSIIASKYRIRDSFIEFLRKHLRNSWISKIELDEKDRIISIPFRKGDEVGIFYLFYKGRTLFYSVHYGDTNVLSAFDKIGRSDIIKSSIENENIVFQELLDKYFKSYHIFKSVKILKRKQKFLLRKYDNISGDLAKVKKWEELKILIESNDFEPPKDHIFELCGIKFKTALKLNRYQKIDILYQKIKRFKIAESLLEDRLSRTKEMLRQFKEDQFEGAIKIIRPTLFNMNSRKVKKDMKNAIKANIEIFELKGGIKCAIGKDTCANDYLRNKWGNKSDIWIHLDGYKGPHVVVKGEQLSSEQLQIIGSMIRDFSQLLILKVPILYTQLKNIKGIAGRQGAVTYKKTRFLTISYLSDWKSFLA